MATNDEAAESVIPVGAARIEKIEEALGPWRQALEGSSEFVTLDLGDVEAADVTLFQALLAFRRSLEDRGRHLLLRPLPEGHPVLETGTLLGIPLEHHFTLVGAGS
jgi:hypothetical protein